MFIAYKNRRGHELSL